MDGIQTESVTTSNIPLNEPAERKSPMSRKEEQEERKRQFFEDLKAAHEKENPEPQAESHIVERAEQEEEKPQMGDSLADKQEDEEEYDLSAKLIPKKRFDKEIEKRKSLEEQVRQERDARIKAQTEMELYNKAIDTLNQKQEQSRNIEPELNVVDEDAHRFYMQKINDLERKYQTQNTNLSEYEKRQQFTQTVNHQAAEFQSRNPDFNEAYAYLLNVESQKAKMFGADDAAAQNYAIQQLQPLAWQAYERGQNVAEVAYNISKSYGYKPNGAKSNGKAANSDLDAVERNMKRSHSALDTIPSVATSVSPEHAAYTSIDGFKNKLAGKFGRGVDRDEFRKAVEKLQKGDGTR